MVLPEQLNDFGGVIKGVKPGKTVKPFSRGLHGFTPLYRVLYMFYILGGFTPIYATQGDVEVGEK